MENRSSKWRLGSHAVPLSHSSHFEQIICRHLTLSFCQQNEIPDAEPECDPSSISAARSLWSDWMALAGSKELTLEVQDYIPFSQ